jgi:competence protein ComEC
MQVTLLLVVVFHPWSASPGDGKLHIDFLDVGQGDAAMVTMPDGSSLLIDAGGRPNFRNQFVNDEGQTFERDTRTVGEAVVSEYLWHRGLDAVDYLLATHADADHISGLNNIALNFRVRAALVGRTPVADAEYSGFVDTMDARAVPVIVVRAGDLLRVGNVTAEVLWPPFNSNQKAGSRNNDSVVLRLQFGERAILLTGDIEAETESALVLRRQNLTADVVKVAHHGSKSSSTESFVRATRARWAIISVVQTSIFGHPHPEVVERWKTSGAEVLTTGNSGTITVTTDGHHLTIETFMRR